MIFKKLILAAAIMLTSLQASASFISLQSQPSVFIENNSISAAIDITNLGDEPAYNLDVTAFCKSSEAKSGNIEELRPDASTRMTVNLGPAPDPPGIYTLVFLITYKDSSGKSYSALNSISMVTDLNSPPAGKISLKAPNVKISSSRIKLPVEVSASGVEQVALHLYLPNEITCRKKTLDLSLTAAQTNTAVFTVTNSGANPGSTYLAIIVADYSQNGAHISKAMPLNITIESNSTKPVSPPLILILSALILIGAALQSQRLRDKLSLTDSRLRILDAIIVIASLLCIEAILLYNLRPHYLFMNTTAVGGDTPAHNYIASHLRESLFGHGRIISWAGGWWCGFPMFQFYFCLPYILIVLLDLLLPFNIAFKLIAVTGIFALAPSAFITGRLLRLPKPIPLVMALLCIPVLFDYSHTMWGVNIYSTLAGMISNSLSFPLTLLFLGSAWRDADRRKFNAVTVLLLTAVLSSHFFTSIVGLITVSIIPFLRKRSDIPAVLGIITAEIATALLLASWWIVPLVAKLQYTAEFGVNWNVDFFKQIPSFIKILSPFLIAAVIMLLHRKSRPLLVFFWMLTISAALFFFGFSLSSVFVNVRLWPFIIFSLAVIEAAGIGYLLSLLPASRALCIPFAAAILIFGIDQPNHVPAWAKWNFEGLESKDSYSVFEKLVLPLRNTPGRLANDLCEENNMLGSSRIFELTPHLTGKPVLEGGIVNSSAASMFSYYIQGETSRNSAGFPSIVKPASFNITNATLHLNLFNVKHFIARWDTTRKALHSHPDWKPLAKEKEWELFELTSHDGSYVFVPEYRPFAVETHPDVMDWKNAGMEWIYNISSISNYFIILGKNEQAPENVTTISASRYLGIMKAKERGMIESLGSVRLPEATVTTEKLDDYSIKFTTSHPGVPHIIKMTWYPNWKSKHGEPIYMITPSFMMIIPDHNDVELYYGSTVSDVFGRVMTLLGLILLLALSFVRSLNRRKPILK